MNGHLKRAALVAATALAAACASAPAGEGDRAGGGDMDLLTRAEIDRGHWSNAYELVRDLRPRWLLTRGPDSFQNPGHVQVYVDGTHLGAVELLRTLPTTGMVRLQWIDPVSAAGRWGMDHAHGVISITYGA